MCFVRGVRLVNWSSRDGRSATDSASLHCTLCTLDPGILVCRHRFLSYSAGFGASLMLAGSLDASVIQRWKVIQLKTPILQVIFCIVDHLACLGSILEWSTNITWNNRGIVDKAEEAAAVTSEKDLLLGTLNSCGKFCSICFFYLLTGLLQVSSIRLQTLGRDGTHDVGQLSFSN